MILFSRPRACVFSKAHFAAHTREVRLARWSQALYDTNNRKLDAGQDEAGFEEGLRLERAW